VEYMNQDDVVVGVESYTAFGYRRPEAGENAGQAEEEAP